ncbi:MAG: hypothetical protein A3D37_00200 [Candidatus Zambryskibacteria bacterium RIFCSPHIGHO2_02_FULL_38_22]|nr:MAG: hypothetical protein A3D37_00200 [Candidatus Zambryskibacteria bacterium RIFCSPHIGHO2_02_FULL_38_22]OHB08658.1 MAG: hypothetical protein A3I19_01265 [Candidatus Zambryskibacteria bacterium RIFCSPLOWO2_02_FULL_38_13]
MKKDQINELTEKLKEWKLKNNKIHRLFVFTDFVSAIRFVRTVADLAEKEKHHPDISIIYNKVRLALWTHDTHGISKKDLSLASKIDRLILK